MSLPMSCIPWDTHGAGAPGELQGQQAAEQCDPREWLRVTCGFLCLWESPEDTSTLALGPQAPDIHSQKALGSVSIHSQKALRSVSIPVLVMCSPHSLSFWGAGVLVPYIFRVISSLLVFSQGLQAGGVC